MMIPLMHEMEDGERGESAMHKSRLAVRMEICRSEMAILS